MKEKRRYIAVVSDKEKVNAVLERYLGIIGMSEANPKIEEKESYLLLSVSLPYYSKVLFAFACEGIKVLATSGTILGLKRKLGKV